MKVKCLQRSFYCFLWYVQRQKIHDDPEVQLRWVALEQFREMTEVHGMRVAEAPQLVGKFVDVTIEGLAPEPYYRVPRAALQPGSEVWMARGDGSVHIVPVRILQRADDDAYVAGALENGQRVITGGPSVRHRRHDGADWG